MIYSKLVGVFYVKIIIECVMCILSLKVSLQQLELLLINVAQNAYVTLPYPYGLFMSLA